MAALTEEQTMIQNQAQSWVTKHAPVQKFREVRDSKNVVEFSQQIWDEMVNMGWAGIIIPEAYGGSDLGYLTFGLILEQTGRQLSASPLFASAFVGASAILLGGSEEQKKNLLCGIADGSQIITLALEETPRHDPTKIALIAEYKAGEIILSGDKTFVAEACLHRPLLLLHEQMESREIPMVLHYWLFLQRPQALRAQNLTPWIVAVMRISVLIRLKWPKMPC